MSITKKLLVTAPAMSLTACVPNNDGAEIGAPIPTAHPRTLNLQADISGPRDPRAGARQGNGDFNADFDAGKRVNPIDADPNARGSVTVNYDLSAPHLDLDIVSTDDAGKPVFARYAYDETADGG